jgi:hypothetical protein
MSIDVNMNVTLPPMVLAEGIRKALELRGSTYGRPIPVVPGQPDLVEVCSGWSKHRASDRAITPPPQPDTPAGLLRLSPLPTNGRAGCSWQAG